MQQPSPGPSSPLPPGMNHHQRHSPAPPPDAVKPRPDDYVYFERSTAGFSSEAVARSTAAKLKLVSYYKVAVDSAIERNARYVDSPAIAPREVLTSSPQADRTRDQTIADADARRQGPRDTQVLQDGVAASASAADKDQAGRL